MERDALQVHDGDMRRMCGLGVCLLLAGCNSPIQPDTRPAVGVWGGAGVRIDVSESGAAVEYDCASGTIDQPIVADAHGRFSVRGTHVREHGGPVRVDETPDRPPA